MAFELKFQPVLDCGAEYLFLYMYGKKIILFMLSSQMNKKPTDEASDTVIHSTVDLNSTALYNVYKSDSPDSLL